MGHTENTGFLAYMNKEFYVAGEYSISRSDYESMPCPMKAWDWNDDKMRELASAIAENFHPITREALCEPDRESQDDDFWMVMENAALSMGMTYYEDMTDKEYKHDLKLVTEFEKSFL